MTTSVLVPTHRTTPAALARVMQAASLASDDVEVVIVDNSGDARKRDVVGGLAGPRVKVVCTDVTDGVANAQRAFDESSGQWIQWFADDDFILDSGMRHLAERARTFADGDGTVAACGGFLVESRAGIATLRYEGLDADRGVERLLRFVRTVGPNLLFYGVLKRDFVQTYMTVLSMLPFSLSYHDQVVSTLMLAVGRLRSIPQFVYLYDLGRWESREGSISVDRGYLNNAGLPPACDRILWLMCGLEGARLLRSRAFAGLIGAEGVPMAELWSLHNHAKLRADPRGDGLAGTPGDEAAAALRAKWCARASIEADEALDDVAGFLRDCGVAKADAYHEFWSGL
ncbi:MAG: glycosyltransferase [Burkholderiaceae bacterium]